MERVASSNDKEFMKQMASRIRFTMNQDVRCDSAEQFVTDLLTIGYLKIVPDEE